MVDPDPDRLEPSRPHPAPSAADSREQPDDGERAIIALSIAIANRDYDAANGIVRDAWFALVRTHGESLRQYLDLIPPAELRERALLTMMLGICYNGVPHRRVKGLRYFATAARSAHGAKSDLNRIDRALILSSESAAYRMIGRPGLGVRSARSAVELLDGMPETERRAISELPRVYSQLGISLFYAGQTGAALDTFEKGFAESPETGPSSAFGNLSMLAGIHALRGDIHEAEHVISLAHDDRWTIEQRSMYPGTFYRIGEAITALERFDSETARAHLGAMVNDRRTIEHWVSIGIAEALTETVAGRPGAGLSGLDSLAAIRGGEGRSAATRSRLAPTRALLQLAAGNADAADVILKRDGAAGIERSIGRARLELAMGRHGAALQELKTIAGVAQTSRNLAEAAAIEAAALLRFPSGTRVSAVVDQLGALLERTHQRLAVALLPPSDLARVMGALSHAGYGHLFDGTAIRSLLPAIETSSLLTERELAVLRGLMTTSSASQIAAELVVSVNTVKTQLKSLYRKLNVSSRDEAIAVALDRHLLVEREH